MFRLIIVSVFLAVTLDASPKILSKARMLHERIVGGRDTDIKEVPYQLAFEYYGIYLCGASIISKNIALTAAQCTNGMSANTLSVRAATSIRKFGGQVVVVQSFCQHPDYDSWSKNNDVSVLKLAATIIFGPAAQPIFLAKPGSDVEEGTEGIIAGWGTTSAGGALSKQLKSVDVRRISDNICQGIYGSISTSMICFGHLDGRKDFCQADFGSPLVVNGIQYGIASWGNGCAKPGYPGVYAKVAALRGAIDACLTSF